MKKSMAAALVMLAVCTIGSAHAGLVNNGGGLIYDTDLNITWYDGSPGDCGSYEWAKAWVEGLNVAGVTGWRFPSTPGTTVGSGVTEGEMGHLWMELGGVEGIPLSNMGPFVNLFDGTTFLSPEYLPDPRYAWGYGLQYGTQGPTQREPYAGCYTSAIAVHDGNISPSGAVEADLAGTWYFQIFSDSPSANAPYWASGTMILDSTGAVTGGTAINDSGITKTLTGGSFTIDSAGQVAGTITLSGGAIENLPHGKLDAGKTVLAMVSSDPNYRGLFVGLKAGGTFTQADLAGTWYIPAIFDQPSANNPYWAAGTMTLNSTGAVIGGTAVNSFGETKSFTSGSLTIDSLGQFSGSFLLSDGVTRSIPHGKLDAGKTTLTMVESDSANRGLFVGLKGGGTFTQADLTGTWYIQAIADQPSANNPYWAAGTMILDSTGAVIGGTAVNSFEETKSFTSGSLTIDSLGQFSGSYVLSDGMVGSIPHGKLDAGKTTLTMVVSNSANRGLFVAAKGGMAGRCSGDIDSDGDVDGSDLAALISNTSLIDLATFAENFGENDCP
jgi:hypothetical protein